MKDYGPETFGKLNAEDYNELHDPGTTAETVALIAELAGKGRVLELAIGTGRVAVPLARLGVSIEGVDASPEMIAKMREKPGGDAIPVTIGDMAELNLEGRFDFAFLIFNTLFNLTSQEDQARCIERTAALLNPGGAFLIEAFVPDLTRFKDGQVIRTQQVRGDTVTFETGIHDPVSQVVNYQYERIRNGEAKLIPLPMRYAFPSEIDSMAQLAGFELETRWGGWRQEAFTAQSEMHVSLYRKK